MRIDYIIPGYQGVCLQLPISSDKKSSAHVINWFNEFCYYEILSLSMIGVANNNLQ